PVAGGGDTTHTVAWAGDALLGIEPEDDAVAWTMNLDDDDLPFISDVLAVDGTLVTDSYPTTGLDPATGEVLWTGRAEHGFTFQVVGGRLVSVGSDALAPVQLPQCLRHRSEPALHPARAAGMVGGRARHGTRGRSCSDCRSRPGGRPRSPRHR